MMTLTSSWDISNVRKMMNWTKNWICKKFFGVDTVQPVMKGFKGLDMYNWAKTNFVSFFTLWTLIWANFRYFGGNFLVE